MQGMRRKKPLAPKVLFAKYDVFNIVAGARIRLKAAFMALPDDEALDDDVIQRLKTEYMLDVPVLKMAETSYEERKTKVDARRLPNRFFLPGAGPAMEDAAELIIHIPFDGDPGVFDIAPSAYNSRLAEGEVVGQELLLRLTVVDSNYDIQGHIDREVQQINWALSHLREKDEYFSQELGAVLAQAIGYRKKIMESQSSIAGRIKIPQRRPAPQPTAVPVAPAHAVPVKKQAQEKQIKKWDVFISHASEDKSYVGPLAKAVEAAGVSVWYDGKVLEWGDDLRAMIDNGLVNCRYGIVVLSRAFLGKKKWTEHELNGLFAREQVDKKLVLPIWHGIVRDDLLQYSPGLADRLAKISKSDSYEDIVNSLLVMLGRPRLEHNQVETGESAPAGPNRDASADARRDGLDEQKIQLSDPGKPTRRVVSDPRTAPEPSQDSEDLSPREIELLWTVAKDPEGKLLYSRTFDGEGIRANGRHFLKDADARAAAEWLGALRRLEDRAFIEAISGERSFFKVTDKGYEAADHLEGFTRWNAESVILRTHYMNAPSEEQTLSCKAILAIPARYFDDQVGADGSVMHGLKERRSLLVEGINPGLLGSWNPNEVEFMDAVDGRVERFQIDGMQFLPVACLKLPILG